MALGSQNSGEGGLDKRRQGNSDIKTAGSVLFTYIHSDSFCEQEEMLKTVTTSPFEQESELYTKLMSNPKSRQEVLNFRTMYIMADFSTEGDPPHSNEKVLVCIKAYRDGSFDMRPGFSKPNKKYRFEDEHGAIYEYRVEDASAKAEPSLARRTAKLQKQVAARAGELRALALGGARFQPPPSDRKSMRLCVLGELLGCADFTRDRLYLEFALRFDPAHWEMASSSWQAHEPGLYKGVTATTCMTHYPQDPATNTPDRWVGHWAHPLEFELLSRGGPVPPSKFPALFFQVCTYDLLNRYTSEGYGWLSLASLVPSSGLHYIRCWRPQASIRDKQQEFFVGGSKELSSMTYLERGLDPGGSGTDSAAFGKPMTEGGAVAPNAAAATAAGAIQSATVAPPVTSKPRILNKYGLKTETAGTLKVRLHCITQQWDPLVEEETRAAASGLPPGHHHMSGGSPAKTPGKRNKKDLSLQAVVERARSRLRDARGGDITVRPGAVSEAPTIRVSPVDVKVQEGMLAELKVLAVGLEPLKFQWFKDDRKLTMATADSPNLIVAEVTPIDAGSYYCQVSNKDGSVNSKKAMLKVEKLARMAKASGHALDESGSLTSHGGRQEKTSSLLPGGGGRGGGPARLGPARVSRLQAVQSSQVAAGVADGGSRLGIPALSPATDPHPGPYPQGQQGPPAGSQQVSDSQAGNNAAPQPGPAGSNTAEGPTGAPSGVEGGAPVTDGGSTASALGPNGLRRKPSRASGSGGGNFMPGAAPSLSTSAEGSTKQAASQGSKRAPKDGNEGAKGTATDQVNPPNEGGGSASMTARVGASTAQDPSAPVPKPQKGAGFQKEEVKPNMKPDGGKGGEPQKGAARALAYDQEDDLDAEHIE